MKPKDEIVYQLKLLAKAYDGITKEIAKFMQRFKSVPIFVDRNLDNDLIFKGMESIKGKISRDLEKCLKHWSIYEIWLSKVPQVGPFISANLILLYYYRFVPVCKKCGVVLKNTNETSLKKCPGCGKETKGDGVFNFKIEEKDFPKISNWWSYMGRGAPDEETGRMRKRKKGERVNWSTWGRTIGWHIGQSFYGKGREGHLYKQFMLSAVDKLKPKNPELTDFHIKNMAKNKMIKLFLSHFWQIARWLDDKPITKPYSEVHLGHVGILEPFYYDGELKNKKVA